VKPAPNRRVQAATKSKKSQAISSVISFANKGTNNKNAAISAVPNAYSIMVAGVLIDLYNMLCNFIIMISFSFYGGYYLK
jgi:hypothetical protein